MTERRHRIHSMEVGPTTQAIHRDLLRRVEERDNLLTTSTLFRLWYRLSTYCTGKPSYPPHETWEALAAHLNGTITESPLEALLNLEAGSEGG